MRLVFSYILVFLLLLRVVYLQVHYVFYLTDSKTYIELFCENQEEPELECNGKCSLAKAGDSGENGIAETLKLLVFPGFIEEPGSLFTPVVLNSVNEKSESAPNNYSFQIAHRPERPPQNLMI